MLICIRRQAKALARLRAGDRAAAEHALKSFVSQSQASMGELQQLTSSQFLFLRMPMFLPA